MSCTAPLLRGLTALALLALSTVALSDITTALEDAATSTQRSEANRARNVYRHPVETLTFFGLKPDMTVLEIHPGNLWYTEVLGPVLKADGQLIVAGYDSALPGQPAYTYKLQEAMEQRLADDTALFGDVSVVKLSPPDSIALGEPGSVDMVLTFRSLHGWTQAGVTDQILRAFFTVLKPGGTLGVVQHRTVPEAIADPAAFTGYLTEQQVVDAATAAGFVLEAKSEINANPRDIRQHPAGVWTLPPTLRLGEVDRDKYLAIGESDRMTLRFRKPE
ncbi:MAG: methyltransferase [Spongiibacteraceae bacterium]|nr:methyltransferase [Spongiibacteraceae bacterium]